MKELVQADRRKRNVFKLQKVYFTFNVKKSTLN